MSSTRVPLNTSAAGWFVLLAVLVAGASARQFWPPEDFRRNDFRRNDFFNLQARNFWHEDDFRARIFRDAAPRNPDDIDDFVPFRGERENTFDWNLFQNMLKNNEGNNMLMSPVSLKLALVLLYEGAQEDTAAELERVMHLPEKRGVTREKFSSMLKSLQEQKPEYKLNIGSRIFMDSSVQPRQRYGAIAESFYSTKILTANFSDTHQSAETINNFVKDLTQGRIPKIVDNEESLKSSLMLIVNALFFKGTWYRQPFNPNDTRVLPFTMPDGKGIQVPYMRANSKFYIVYADDLDAKILRLPYAGHKYSMYIVLPQKAGPLSELAKKITPGVINKNLWLMQELPADVMIPKFKFDFTSHLGSDLQELGIKDIFRDSATLTGILRTKTTSRRLAVSDIVQKAGIEVSEQGTVAYTASEIEIGNKMNDETFHANRPFLFYIEDESSGAILYMGVVNNPLEETGIAAAAPSAPQPQPEPSRLGEHETSSQEDPDDAETALGLGYYDRQNFFNIELLQALNTASPGNVIAGTSSVKAALMVLAEAAGGQTRQQIVSALRLPSDPRELHQVAGSTLTPYKNAGTELQHAIKLWLSRDVSLVKNFSEHLQQYYKGELQGVNFADAANTVKTINDWVKKFTNGRISSIVDPTSLAPDTRMLLTTAVYFKGTWQQAFDKTATRTRCFNVPALGCQQVEMMENVAFYKYAEVPALDAQVVQIPYTGERISMVVLLPQRSGEQALKDLSRDLTFTPVSTLMANLKEQEILLQIPKFSIRSQTDMKSQLQELGIRDLFEDNANLSTGFPRGNVKVSGVIHNAQIDVNEEGTVASAVTGVSVIPLIGSTATTFRADRPFIFFLLDNETNGIIFAGRYVQPDQPMMPAAPAAAPAAVPETFRNSYINPNKFKTG